MNNFFSDSVLLFYRICLLFIAVTFSIPFKAQAQPEFGNRIDKGLIENHEITEASGIDASEKNINILWVHNDSGNPNRIFAISSSGKNLGTYVINGITNRDWEDIAVAPGPQDSEEYIYIGDIGDNDAKYDVKFIYRILEPSVDTLQSAVEDTLFGAETISFKFPDGPRDAETLMIDPLTKDIYIVSKREDSVRVYRAPYPQSTKDTITLEKAAVLNLSLAVSGDISSDGSEILIKNYTNIFYWKKTEEQNLREVFKNKPDTLPYTFNISEILGEAVSWSYNNNGYFTTNEGSQPHLYFYPRQSPTSADDIYEKHLQFELYQNYPNPFNPSTKIKYTIPAVEKKHASPLQNVMLKVYDILGREIATLVNKSQSSGNYEIEFDGSKLSSGIYFYKLSTGVGAKNYSTTKKMILLK